MSQSSNETPILAVTPKEAKAKLWKLGNLSWKLDSNQIQIRDMIIKAEKKISVLVCSRQIGKTYAICTIAIEECMSKPNRLVKIIAPEVKMIKQILQPKMREIFLDCPKDLVAKYKGDEHKYVFPNGSEIQLAGTDNGHAESIRGTVAHLCIIDEAGFCNDLDYIIKSILIPTTTTTKGKIILSSTPPKTNDHPFMGFWAQAEINNTLFKRTIYDNPRLTPKDIEELAEAVGGTDSIDFRREYLCEKLISAEDAIVPEFNETLEQEIVKEWTRPAFYDVYASMDIGFRDLTVVLLAYYDFRAGKLIIEDELVIPGSKFLTKSFAEELRVKEKALWTHPISGETKEPYLRVSDNNNLILLNDLSVNEKIHFTPIQKDNSDAALNHMRMMLKQRKIIINPRCKTLVFHLKNGIWNKQRSSYMRSQDAGHFDAIDSLKYLCRGLQPNKNPYPAHYQFESTKDLFFPTKPMDSKDLSAQIKTMFTIPRRRR